MSKLKTQIFLSVVFVSLLIFPFFFVSHTWAEGLLMSNSTTPAPSIEYNLPYPGILPDHPLYFFKQFRDQILLWMTRDLSKKSQLNLLLSDKHLAMGQLLWEKGNLDLSVATLAKGEKYLLSTALIEVKLKSQNSLLVGEADKLELATKKHEEILTKLIDIAPNETTKQRLTETVGVTHQTSQQVSLLK